ncbi:hypothetical protein [Acidithiobacillus ferriphilus]|jgi:hypothetical protein|uniref:hypothetical protein n=1 Tax=Acidithiobacillus ferriphilus TaxID=1689834 RepID=UPI00232D2A71|nr:hypothetical protein [Acidithiobacillus ferriphilus]WCE94809.1 hypothetical protein PJU76_04500 [Acidithiobacillus ferriphilus]
MRIQAGQSIILAIDLQDRLLGTLPPARRTPLQGRGLATGGGGRRLALGVLP